MSDANWDDVRGYSKLLCKLVAMDDKLQKMRLEWAFGFPTPRTKNGLTTNLK